MKKNTILLFLILIIILIVSIAGCGGGGRGTKDHEPSPTPIPGNIGGIVKDATDDKLLDGVIVTVCNSANQPITQGNTDNSGKYAIPVGNGNNYNVVFSKSNYKSAIYNNINVNGSTFLETVSLQKDNAGSSENGTVSGKIIDGAVQGGNTGIEGVTINFREGINTTTGNIINTTTTDHNGDYSQELPVGYYTAELSKEGWITTYMSVICPKGGQNGVMTPIILNDRIRIILTWDERPKDPLDLDAHLTGPLAPGDLSSFPDVVFGRFHTYYSDTRRTYIFNGTKYAELDVDDKTGFGPETTTIYKFCSGTYRFSVHEFTLNENSTALADSGARVKVFQGSALIATFNVPVNQPGIVWTVFELDGDSRVITPINTVTKATNDIKIQSSSSSKKMP